MNWTEARLDALPRKGGFRLRGLEITRLETFTDAAFAFATTLLVISLSGIPGSYSELVEALKGTPAFAASFASVASFWYSHREWSRKYGLEDMSSTIISLSLVFVMMVFVYPLKMVFAALFHWISNGFLPTNFVLTETNDLTGLFVIYGIGFFAMNTCMLLLFWRARSSAEELKLNTLERWITRSGIVNFGTLSLTGLLSFLWAWLAPGKLGIWAGFAYATLPISMPLLGNYYGRKHKKLLKADK
jgi:uncharacterized membrane protein